MTVLSSEYVLAELRRLPLLTPDQRARVEKSARKAAPGPEKIASRLVDRGWLTPFQAEMLLTGKAESLIFGHYVLLARLGEGGMGAVFQARHQRLGRIDAVKVIRADKITSKLIARRFLREIHLTADLNHPHIVKALDAGQVGQQLYLATEYVRGEDLMTAVRRDGPLTVADACLAIYQTALALRHIHERGLIHRDLKPSNLMREDGTRVVKLLDLGLSGSLNALPEGGSYVGNLTRDGVMLGTPDFMPPEQARDPHGVDIRADLYGLGCTFFYILTGRTPFEGSAVDKLMQHASAPPPELVLPGVSTPPALAAIVAKLMAKQPEDRFANPQALIDAMLALRTDSSAIEVKPSSDSPRPPPEGAADAGDDWQSQFNTLIAQDPSMSGRTPAPKPQPRGRGHRPWIAAVVVALLAVPIALFAFTRTSSNASPSAKEAAAIEEEPVDDWKQLRKAVQSSTGSREALRNRVLAFRAKKMGTAQAANSAGLLRRLPSPLDRLALAAGPTADAPALRLGESEAEVRWLAFGPGDDRLWVGRRGQPAEEWELPAARETGRFREVVPSEESAALATPDGRTLLAVDAAGQLIVFADGRTEVVPLGPGLTAAAAAISPDGKTAIVAFNSKDRLARVNLDTGKILNHLEHPSGGIESLTISPDGSSCLVVGPKRMLRTLSVASGKLQQSFDGPPGLRMKPEGCFGPDGQRLYLIGAFQTPGRFPHNSAAPEASYELGPERPNPFVPRPGQAEPRAIAVSADEALAAVGTRTGRVYVYSAGSGKPVQELRCRSTITALAFSTHGRVLAIGLADGTVLLVKVKG